MSFEKKFFWIFFVIALGFCGRFRVTHLSPTVLLSLPVGSDGLEYPVQSGVLHGLPKTVGVIDNWFIISEPSQEAIKIFNGTKIHLKLVSKYSLEKKATKKDDIAKEVKTVVNELLRVPGRIVAGREEDFYVVNYIPPLGEGDFSSGAYRILHFDFSGKLLQVVGRKGQSELPFENILWFDIDIKGNLWVLYSHLEELHLDQYQKGKLLREIRQKQCEEVLFANTVREKGMLYRCEFLYPFYDASKILFIGRVDRADAEGTYQFQYRVVVSQDEGGESRVVFSRLNDPEDYPHIPYGTGEFIVWQTLDYQKIRFALYNLSGELVNNLQLDFMGRFTDWRSTWVNLKGDIFSLRVIGKNVEILKWR